MLFQKVTLEPGLHNLSLLIFMTKTDAIRTLQNAAQHIADRNPAAGEQIRVGRNVSKSTDPDVQALAILAVVFARVIEVKDDWAENAGDDLGLVAL